MSIASVNERGRALAAGALLLSALSLGGCATATVGSSLMDARAEVPPPRQTSTYLPVEDLPPNRKVMTVDERSKLKNELTAARDRQARAAKANEGALEPIQPANQAARQ